MEVFRYITPEEHRRIHDEGVILPREDDSKGFVRAEGLPIRPLYGIPEDPLVWGIYSTRNLLSWIKGISGLNADTLIRFVIDATDTFTPIFVQDQSVNRVEQAQTRKPVNEYKKGEFVRPEVLIGVAIPKSQITVVEFPRELTDDCAQ